MLTIPNYEVIDATGVVRHKTSLYAEALRVQTQLTRRTRTLHLVRSHNV